MAFPGFFDAHLICIKVLPADLAHLGLAMTEEKLRIDARGLEPPQPLQLILEALAALPKNVEVDAYTDRRPMHLLALLTQRGYTSTSELLPDGTHCTHIRRA